MEKQALPQALADYIARMESPLLPQWEGFPELELYMDQVMVFMEKYLALFSSGKDRLITPSMINNYVKLGMIPPPIKKKYNREHLARLMTICMLKQIMPIPVLAYLMDKFAQEDGLAQTYDLFVQQQRQALQQVGQDARQQLGAPQGQDEYQALAQLALRLSAQANANRILAENITALLQEQAPLPGKKKSKDSITTA